MTSDDLRKSRLMLGLNQREMSLLMGMPAPSYSRIESGDQGRKPTRQHANAVELLKYINMMAPGGVRSCLQLWEADAEG
ncbi:MAG: helix-turn-helix transcriptional regulator [Abyssibacter sp.]|uniref:helix-turn-helix domain-containing protein n=1 Tax=Abyssibacter sp. TaxID=2320200 RepID=UPI003219058D